MKRSLLFTVAILLPVTLSACNEEENTSDEEADVEEGTVSEDIELLFHDEEAQNMYRESRTISADTTEDLPVAAVEEWLNGPQSDELYPLVNDEDVHVQYVEDHGDVAHISFSPEFTDINVGSAAELALVDQVAHILSQFDYESTQFLVDGETQDTLFGHVDSSEPYTPDDDLDAYEQVEEKE